ncbi:hypothetical protein FIV42_20720 [Persicimonas caeni]|uniref:Uncharacterized protein n=1 Tax=Persicimonas caeni TaxID=2292766 RepID=A0A4Y6PY40_PERCE|nr:hypothetical protein [Persicimonas caeni]QDG53079.1 hypothetical protein FIV42_20720 [Persicimonas caeni]QED34301.1 hypothetical protein FRD00_20715 [Persicimonas caeni]
MRRVVRVFLATVVLAGVSAVALGACSWRIDWPEHRLDVFITHESETERAGQGEQVEQGASADAVIVNDLGFEVRVDAAYLVTDTVTLLACDEVDDPRDLPGFSLRTLTRALLPSAHAHGPTTPTRLGTPHVEALVGASSRSSHPWRIGEFLPPPGDYCAVRLDVRAADDDAIGLPADVDMVGRTLYVRGTYLAPDEDAPNENAPKPFELATGAAFDIELDKVASTTGAAAPWSFPRSGAKTGRVILNKNMAAWFEGVDFTDADPEQTARAVLLNARESIELDVELGS